MQLLFLMWNKKGALVRAECWQRYGSADPRPEAKARLTALWSSGAAVVDRCTIYQIEQGQLKLMGGVER